jgi:hypothetical protein
MAEAGAPVYVTANWGSLGAPSVTLTAALPTLVSANVCVAGAPRLTEPNPFGPDRVSVPPRGVILSGTVTVAKPGTSVVMVSAPVIATPAVEVIGIVLAPIEIDPDAPAATVPDAPLWIEKPELTDADHVIGDEPEF